MVMTRQPALSFHGRARLTRAVALAMLLLLGVLAFAGPSGFVAWRENVATLAHHKAQIARLEAERGVLKNRVDLLDPQHADPDLVGELLRSNLNVAHPDEVVVTLK